MQSSTLRNVPPAPLRFLRRRVPCAERDGAAGLRTEALAEVPPRGRPDAERPAPCRDADALRVTAVPVECPCTDGRCAPERGRSAALLWTVRALGGRARDVSI